MKKKAVLLALLLCCTAAVLPASAASKTSGWKKTKGQTYYYKKGKAVKGMVKIGSKTYYFDKKGRLVKKKWVKYKGKTYRTDKNGAIVKNRFINVGGKHYRMKADGTLQKGWKTFSYGKSYFGSNGVLRKGVQKIGGKVYYFTDRGVMKTGIITEGNTTYYVSKWGVVKAKRVVKNGKAKYLDANNKALSSAKAQEYEAKWNAHVVVAQITNSKMSKEEKLLTCFRWVMSKPYITFRTFGNFDGWVPTYANDHFTRGGGNCQSDAAAFAYLARELGYSKIYVCVDSDGTNPRGHSWTEINGKVYDPLFAEAKSFSRYYGVSYGTYELHPILKVRV